MIGLPPAARKTQSRRWARLFAVGLVASTAAYAVGALAGGVEPGNVWGLTFGSIAMALMIGVGAWGIRRRAMAVASRWHLGDSRSWLLFHLYGGTLFMLVTVMHMSFRFPHGIVTSWLFWVSVLTVISGFFGLALQRSVPRSLASGTDDEILFDRIPDLLTALRKRGEELAAECKNSLVRALYEETVVPELASVRRRGQFLFDPSGGGESRWRTIEYLKPRLDPPARQQLDELESILRAKASIDAHATLQPLLRFWLYSHLPVSLLAYALLILHLYAVWAW
jgi:hypothetical protein